MNTTTFTVESVHGLKQTFVLGPAKPTENDTSKDDVPHRQHPVDAQEHRQATRTPR